MCWVVTSSEPSRGKLVPAENDSSRELSIDREVLVGDEGRGDDTEESVRGDDNGDEESRFTGTVLGVLTESAISCWADSNDSESCPHAAASSV